MLPSPPSLSGLPALAAAPEEDLSVSENLDEIPRRIIGLTLVLTLPYATHMFAYAVHLEQVGLTQTLRPELTRSLRAGTHKNHLEFLMSDMEV